MCGTRIFPYCRMAERLLKKKGISIEQVLVDEAPERREEMERITGRTAVPQIFVGDTHLGGYAELITLDRNGRLDVLLQAEAGAG